MVSITPQVSSTYFVRFKENYKSTIQEYSRRVNKTRTIDGSSTIDDLGCTDTDRTLYLKGKITEAQHTTMKYMIETYAVWTVVVKGQCYSCAPKNMKCDNGDLELTLLVKE